MSNTKNTSNYESMLRAKDARGILALIEELRSEINNIGDHFDALSQECLKEINEIA